jgi:hypothetical protein
MTEKPIVRFALLCEDVRREITGKDIIIGVLGTQITTAQFPIAIILNLYMRIRFPNTGMFNTEFRVLGPPTNQPITAIIKTNMAASSSETDTTINLSGIAFQVLTPGVIKFQWRLEGDEVWITVAELSVKQGSIEVPGMIIGRGTVVS